MYFNNPDIIKSSTDVILGGVRTDEENLSFLNLINRAIQFYSIHIRRDVEALMGDGTSHEKALRLTAKKIFSRLSMYQEIVPNDETHLAELMMESRNYEMWKSDIRRRFLNTHTDKMSVETKIPVSNGEGVMSQEEMTELFRQTNLDLILERLSMYMDIGNPSND